MSSGVGGTLTVLARDEGMGGTIIRHWRLQRGEHWWRIETERRPLVVNE